VHLHASGGADAVVLQSNIVCEEFAEGPTQ